MVLLRCILLASAPAVFWMWVYYRRDQHPEPKRLVLRLFLWGALMTIPVYLLQGLSGPTDPVFDFFVRVGLLEELFKFLPVLLVAVRLKEFDEPMDGIVYAVAAGLGFATVENVLYAFRLGDHMIFYRAFTATPAHVAFSGLLGYHLGRARFSKRRRGLTVVWALLAVSALHGSYDALLAFGAMPTAPAYVSQGTIIVIVPMMLLMLSWAAYKADRASPLQDERQLESEA